MRRINASGRFFVSHTMLDGRFTIRAAIGNIRTEQRDVEELWMAIAEALDSPRDCPAQRPCATVKEE
jgi:aromatic-L-amino-acid decarboxylase